MAPKRQSNLTCKRRKSTELPKTQPVKRRLTFFHLPPEIRNTIYDLALISPRRIKITRTLKEPTLLLTTRQIRTEAVKIFYLRNTFYFEVRKCDASLANAFERHSKKYWVLSPRMGGGKARTWLHHTSILYKTGGRKSWANLERWCEQIWKYGLSYIAASGKHSRLRAMIAAAHAVVLASRKEPWEKCLVALLALRQAVGRVDPAWLRED